MRTMLIVLFLTMVVSAQTKVKQVETPCHKLVAELHTRDNMIWRWGLHTAPLNEELLKQMDRLGAMSIQLHHCATDTPEQFSTEDWKWAVLEASDLQDDLDAISRTFEKATDDTTTKVNVLSFSDRLKTCNDEYNQLVKSYNDLVSAYNDQREMLIRLSATNLRLPPPPTSLHCTTFRAGSIGTIDCD
jgi:hypothetical protein